MGFQSVLQKIAREEEDRQSPGVIPDGRLIYRTPCSNPIGIRQSGITDFDLTVRGLGRFTYSTQFSRFQAHEIPLGAGWMYNADD